MTGSPGPGLGELAAEVARLSDIAALNHLIDRYLAGLDEGLASSASTSASTSDSGSASTSDSGSDSGSGSGLGSGPGSGSGFDAVWAASLFTEDVELLFPVGSHQGLTGADGFLREIMERWGRTHHHGSLASVEPDGDLAAVSWSLIASHVHFGSPLPPQPSAYFQIGGRFTGVARRTPDGWRFARLRLRIVWSTGSPPGGVTEVDARTLEAADSRP
ncbi:nuclear transport factor 2 family protein [Streptomyces microflavus]|uniref:nuclear transport factor 2 family protein n=1 Tax=Streptomyces microflavus TaxID=1919 RepID=UPI0036CCE0A3